MKMKELCAVAILGLFLILNPTSADALFISFGDPNAGGVTVVDNGPGDANKTVGVIQVNNLAVANFTATGTLFALGTGGGAFVQRVLLTNLTVQATANITDQTVAFGNDIQQVFPGATLVHLDGRYEHGGGGMIGQADIRLDGFVSNPMMTMSIGTVDPLAVMNVPSPRPFTYPAGTGPDAKGNLSHKVPVTSIGGLLTFTLNNADLFVLPGSAEVAVSESDEELFPTTVPEPSTLPLVGTALGCIVALYLRRRIFAGFTKSPM